MSKLLALDQSSRITGYAIFEDGKLLKYGKFEYSGDISIPDRLYGIRETVLKLISSYNITEVVLEDIQMQGNVVNNVQTFKILAEVFGIISELCVELNLPQRAVLASTWKSGLGIKGKDRAAQKRAAQDWVVSTYGVRPTQDECDAVCIGSYANKNSTSLEGFSWAD